MSHYSLKTIFESSGSLRRIHLPQEYAPLERYIHREVIKLESLQLQSQMAFSGNWWRSWLRSHNDYGK